MGRPKKLPPGLWLRGRTYYARFRFKGRLICERLATDFDAACDILNELRARASRGDFGLTDNDYPWQSLKEKFLKFKRQTGRNPEHYEADLAMFESYSRVGSVRQIDHEWVIGFREWRLAGGGIPADRKKKTITPRTVNRQVGVLRSMLNRAVEWKLISFNPIADVKPLRHDSPAKDRRSLTGEEVERLFAESPARLRPVWRAFMCTGIRHDELVSMKFTDIDFDRQMLTIRAANAKSRKAREVYLDDETFGMIEGLRAEAADRQPVAGLTPQATERQRANFSREHVFVTKANTPWRNNLLTRFYAICRRAEIEGAHRGGSVDIHSLRVSFATLSLENGANPRDVQSILGHSTLALTMSVYAKATERGKRAAVNALPFAKVRQPEHVVSIPKSDRIGTSSNSSPQTLAMQAVT